MSQLNAPYAQQMMRVGKLNLTSKMMRWDSKTFLTRKEKEVERK